MIDECIAITNYRIIDAVEQCADSGTTASDRSGLSWNRHIAQDCTEQGVFGDEAQHLHARPHNDLVLLALCLFSTQCLVRLLPASDDDVGDDSN